MTINNRWRHGPHDFAITVLPDRIGTVGCVLLPVVVDEAVGVEAVLLFTDEQRYMAGYADVSPLHLIATTGIIATPHGPVAFIVWQIAAHSPAEFFIEQFLNPASAETRELIERAGMQSHLKLVIADNLSSAVSVFIDFENCFALDELADMMSGVDCPHPVNSFGMSVDHVMANYDLIAAARG